MHEQKLLDEKQLNSALPTLLGEANHRVILISAFLKSDVVKWLRGLIDSRVEVIVVSRWRKSDLINGASDLSIFEICTNYGWDFLIDFRLHAKVLVVDHKKIILGSSNYTNSGLGIGAISNNEMNIIFEPSIGEIERIQNFIKNSTRMTHGIYKKMCEEIEGVSRKQVEQELEWSTQLTAKLNTDDHKLWVSECLLLSPIEFASLPLDKQHNDKMLWGEGGPSLQKTKSMRLFRWLDAVLEGETKIVTYGNLSRLLHSSIINDPAPYRADIKQCVGVLFDWIEEFNLYEVVQFQRTKGIVNKNAGQDDNRYQRAYPKKSRRYRKANRE